MGRLIRWGWGVWALLWAAAAYAMVRRSETVLSDGLAGISTASLLLAVLLALIGGTANMFQRLAARNSPVRSMVIEVGSVITASIVAGLSAFFFCEWRGWPAPLTALVITLASWGGKRVLDQAVDAGLRRIQGEKQ
ncbi:MAG: phage holin family protein [Pararobbsia sp.]